jgi:hypothetical protein
MRSLPKSAARNMRAHRKSGEFYWRLSVTDKYIARRVEYTQP